MVNILAKLKQAQVLSFIVLLIIQVGARYGYQFDSVAVQTNVLWILDAATWLVGALVAHKSDKGSII